MYFCILRMRPMNFRLNLTAQMKKAYLIDIFYETTDFFSVFKYIYSITCTKDLLKENRQLL